VPRPIRTCLLVVVVALVLIAFGALAQSNSPTWVLDDEDHVWECRQVDRVLGSLTISSDVSAGHVLAYGAAFNQRNNVLLSVFSLEYAGVDNAGIGLIFTQAIADPRTRRAYGDTLGKLRKGTEGAKHAAFHRSTAAWLAGAAALHDATLSTVRHVRLPVPPTTFNLDAWALAEVFGGGVPQVQLAFDLKETRLITSISAAVR